MNVELSQALSAKLLALADDEFILGHRDSEWCGHAPILEEDIAFANIAQDELGHSILWYEALQTLTGKTPDQQTFFREANNWRNTQLVELPKGDWAFTMLRQYLFDAYELALLEQLVNSTYQPIADIATKARPEEVYHYRHTSNWVKRLGLGTEESNRRMQAALDTLWPFALQLFVPLAADDILMQTAIIPDGQMLRSAWENTVRKHLADSRLVVPDARALGVTSREQHTEHLDALLTDMQEVARTESLGTEW